MQNSPQTPVITSWGMWLDAIVYYSYGENFEILLFCAK
jgi:hypothetical protein